MQVLYNTTDIELNFTRTEEVQKSYDLYLKKLKTERITPREAVLEDIRLNGVCICHNGYITPNNYPYDVVHKHYVFWVFEPMENIVEHVLGYFPETVLIFKNNMNNKSVKDLEHYHVFL